MNKVGHTSDIFEMNAARNGSFIENTTLLTRIITIDSQEIIKVPVRKSKKNYFNKNKKNIHTDQNS